MGLLNVSQLREGVRAYMDTLNKVNERQATAPRATRQTVEGRL